MACDQPKLKLQTQTWAQIIFCGFSFPFIFFFTSAFELLSAPKVG
jgi:hypothetical protein